MDSRAAALGIQGEKWTLDLDIKLIEEISRLEPHQFHLYGKEDQLRKYLDSVYSTHPTKVYVHLEFGWPRPQDNSPELRKLVKKIRESGINRRTENSLTSELRIMFGYKDFPRTRKKESAHSSPSLHNPPSIPQRNLVHGVQVYTKELYTRIPKAYRSVFTSLSQSFLTGGRVGLEWIEQGSSALYKYPDVNEVDFARMFLDILDYLKKRGEQLDDYLKKRANQKKEKLYEVFPNQPPVPLDSGLLIPLDNSPVTVLTSLFLVELAILLKDLSRMSFPTLSAYDSVLSKLYGILSTVHTLQTKGILKQDSAIDALSRRCAAVSDFSIPREDNNEQTVIPQEILDKIDESVTTINSILAGLMKNPMEFPPFYIQMRTLFELYAYVYLYTLGEGQYALKYQEPYSLMTSAHRKVTSTPDISVCDKGDIPLFLIDAKWKKNYINPLRVSKSDCEQAKKFLLRSGTSQLFLTYPAGGPSPAATSFDEYLQKSTIVPNYQAASSEQLLTVPLRLPLLQ